MPGVSNTDLVFATTMGLYLQRRQPRRDILGDFVVDIACSDRLR